MDNCCIYWGNRQLGCEQGISEEQLSTYTQCRVSKAASEPEFNSVGRGVGKPALAQGRELRKQRRYRAGQKRCKML